MTAGLSWPSFREFEKSRIQASFMNIPKSEDLRKPMHTPQVLCDPAWDSRTSLFPSRHGCMA
jgi:hypothetical protein